MQNYFSSLYNQRYRIKRRYIDCNFTKDNLMKLNIEPILKTDLNYKKENLIIICDAETKRICQLINSINLEDKDKILIKETKKSKKNNKNDY